MVLFFANEGPLVEYDNGVFYVSNLNPEVCTQWRMTRWELIKFSLCSLFAAFTD